MILGNILDQKKNFLPKDLSMNAQSQKIYILEPLPVAHSIPVLNKTCFCAANGKSRVGSGKLRVKTEE